MNAHPLDVSGPTSEQSDDDGNEQVQRVEGMEGAEVGAEDADDGTEGAEDGAEGAGTEDQGNGAAAATSSGEHHALPAPLLQDTTTTTTTTTLSAMAAPWYPPPAAPRPLSLSSARTPTSRTVALTVADYLLAHMATHWARLRNLSRLELRNCPAGLAQRYPQLFRALPSLAELRLVGPDTQLKEVYGPSQPSFKVQRIQTHVEI